jgi:hypothetical protein
MRHMFRLSVMSWSPITAFAPAHKDINWKARRAARLDQVFNFQVQECLNPASRNKNKQISAKHNTNIPISNAHSDSFPLPT